jgi:hypothetical protein
VGGVPVGGGGVGDGEGGFGGWWGGGSCVLLRWVFRWYAVCRRL